MTKHELIQQAKEGALYTKDFLAFLEECQREEFSFMHDYLARDAFHDSLSWGVFTVEYADSLARILRGKRVLEVCAGKGCLAAMMKSRGIDWVATDIKPHKGIRWMGATKALNKIPHDVVYASWIPYKSELDVEIAKATLGSGKMFIFLGEPDGGCTGSQQFWDLHRADVRTADDVFPGFWDAPQWPGIHDYTWVLGMTKRR